jgi:diguanylate cyclase (GGDEF)-like protein
MELKTYLRVLLRHWWIVLAAFLITLTATIVFTFSQPSQYLSTATFVVSPSSAFQDTKSFISGLDILSRRSEIATTYSEVALSRTVRKAALDALGLPLEQRRSVSVSSQLLAGTNILKITVEAQDPTLAKSVADVTGAETITYAKSLYEPFVLRPLDEATLPNSPSKPNKRMNIILGGVFGLVLGAGLAFLAEYLRTPPETTVEMSIIDANTSVYNKDYFLQRLGIEMARARRQRYPLSVALWNVDHLGTLQGMRPPEARNELLRKTAVILKQYLREEDLVAYFGDASFALLLPDMSGEAAKAMVDRMQTRMAWTPFELEQSGTRVNLSSVVGVATFNHNGMDQDELMAQASHALQRAGTNGYGQTHLVTEEAVSERERPATD